MSRILLMICGLTPQICTEAIYGLNREGNLPQRVMILTTRLGRERCLQTLLGPQGMLARFLSDYDLPAASCQLREDDILALPGDDISTLEESGAFQNLCLEQVCRLTQDLSNQIDFCIAGGRKTMGASLALAAQCYARNWDRIFHVLVSPEFELQREFFYPPPEDAWLQQPPPLPPLNMKDARVTLVMVPFARLRGYLPSIFLRRPQQPEDLFASLALPKSPALTLQTESCTVSIEGKSCALPPVEFALLLDFVLRKKEFLCAGACASCPGHCFLDLPAVLSQNSRLARLYRNLSLASPAQSTTGILNLSAENFMAYKAKLHRRLRKNLGMAAVYAEIVSLGVRPHVRYGLRLPRDLIFINPGGQEPLH